MPSRGKFAVCGSGVKNIDRRAGKFFILQSSARALISSTSPREVLIKIASLFIIASSPCQ
jgi:hypothetical protein